jgi:peptidyl-prolyl cis-trans isomerase SurA
MKHFILLFAFLLILPLAAKANDYDDKVLAEIGDEEITYKRLEYAFQKNMVGEKKELRELEKDSLLNFLDLFVKYRLKVKDAIDRGYHQDPELVDEITTNKNLLTESYYYDKKVFQPAVNRLLNRRQYYLKFGYILFPYTEEAEGKTQHDPKDFAQTVLDSINTGKITFAQAAKNHAPEKDLRESGGIVNKYLISGTIQKPIEDVLFELSPGQLNGTLLKTDYGYFIIKLVEKMQRVQIKAAHILIGKESTNDILTDEHHSLADSLLNLIKNGESFEKLAELHSDDHASAVNGGELHDYYDLSSGFVKNKGILDDYFVNTLVNLKDGEISDTIHTVYGIHIVKRVDTKKPDIEKDRKEIESMYKRTRYDEAKKDFYENYVRKNGFKLNSDALSSIISNVDYTKTNLDSNWANEIPKDIYGDMLFEFDGQEWTVSEFINILSDKSKTDFRATALNRKGLQSAMFKIVKPKVLEMWSDELMNDDVKYQNLVNEFRDGILLFKVEAIEVWDKLELDTAMAKQYFDTTSTKFYTEKKYDLSEIFILQDTLSKELYRRIQEGEDFDELAANYTVRQGYREKKGHHGVVSAEKNKFSRQLKGEEIKDGVVIPPKDYMSGISIIKINKIIEPREKTFEEAIIDIAPIVQSMKQQMLVDNWLDRVKEKHEVEINNDVIDEIYED